MTESDQKIVARFAVPPKKVACGFYHTLFIKYNTQQGAGDLVETAECHAHGGNMYNMLSLAGKFRKMKGATLFQTFQDQLFPAQVVCADFERYGEIYDVACGTSHSMFLVKKPDEVGGVLFAAGLGNRGRLGQRQPGEDEDDEIEDTWWTEDGAMGPILAEIGGPPLSVLRVDCGSDHTVCFCTDGRLYAWGANKEGQCGVDIKSDELGDVRMPKLVALPAGKQINHFACGGLHSLAVIGDGELYTWGCGKDGRLGVGSFENRSRPMAVSLGDSQCLFVAGGEAHSGLIDQDGTAWTWGAGSYGRLGHGDDSDMQVPKRIEYFNEIAEKPGQIRIMAIALGGFHSLFLEEPDARNGQIYTCGAGVAVGFLSADDTTSVKQPRLLSDAIFGAKGMIRQIAAGMYHNYVLLENGDLIRWGVGSNGRLGQKENMKVSAMTAPTMHKSMKGYVIRFNPDSQQMTPLTHPTERRVEDKVEKKKDGDESAKNPVRQVSCGAMHSMALIKGGQLYVWGSNANGQLGLGSTKENEFAWIPTKLTIGNGRAVREIAAGFEHCLAITTYGECWAWGKGNSGQLGIGRARDCFEPTHVVALQQVVTIAAGEEHSAAIQFDAHGVRQLFTWGSAENGMLGLGPDFTSGPQTSPQLVQFGDVGNLKAITMTKASASTSGQLQPMKIRCGNNHTAVIVGPPDGPPLEVVGGSVKSLKDARIENKVFTFGGGWFGRLGLNSQSNVYSPTEVKFDGPRFTIEIGCGAYHTAALSRTSELTIWGHKEMVGEVDHQYEPKKVLIDIEAPWKTVICGEMHTCAITSKGELFVWGKNSMGQLGLGHMQHQHKPEQVTTLPAACVMAATGASHLLCVCGGGEIHACGNQSCGRLGLENKDVKEKYVNQPAPVLAEWASIQSMSAVAAEKKEPPRTLDSLYSDAPKAVDKVPKKFGETDQDHSMAAILKTLEAGQRVTSFGTMQTLIKQEQVESRPKELQRREEELQKRLKEQVLFIESLFDNESKLKNLQSDLQQSLESNMKYFKSCTTPSSIIKLDPELVEILPVYEKLLWVLQQQVCYLARLSVAVAKSSEEDQAVFHRIVARLYKDSDNELRTHYAYLLCMRQMFVLEVDAVGRLTVDNAFDKNTSRAFKIFSTYALSNIHWDTILHRYLKVPREDKKSKDEDGHGGTLLTQFKNNQYDLFAIGFPDFMQVYEESGAEKKDPQEMQSIYDQNRDVFKEFMTTSFLAALTQTAFPKEIRLLLNYIHHDVMARQPSLGQVDPDIPQEMKIYTPILHIFVHAILIPILRDAKKYCNKKCLLNTSAAVVDDSQIYSNMNRVANFLERMVNDDFAEKDMKSLIPASKKVKLQLLEYLKVQVSIVNNLEARAVMEAYACHYDRSKRYVFCDAADLLKLSNLLKMHDSQLRMSENDRMASLIAKIPKWTTEQIQEAEEGAASCELNFVMNHRFLFEAGDPVVICTTSRMPVPASMAASGAPKNYFKTYQVDNPNDPRRELESLFLELHQMNCKSFLEMKTEFEQRRIEYRQSGNPDYELMQRLQDGLRIVEELENVQAHPDDVLYFMSCALIDRDRHFQYLQIIRVEIDEMVKKRENYTKNIQKSIRELELALDRSRELSLPDKIRNVSSMTVLKFDALKKATGKRLMDPKETKALNLTYTPIKIYPMKKLEKIGVVKDVAPPFNDAVMRKDMQVTFRVTPGAAGAGAVQLIVNIVKKGNKTTVKTISISDETIADMKTAEKGKTLPLKNEGEEPFMTIDCAEFMKVMIELSQSAG